MGLEGRQRVFGWEEVGRGLLSPSGREDKKDPSLSLFGGLLRARPAWGAQGVARSGSGDARPLMLGLTVEEDGA